MTCAECMEALLEGDLEPERLASGLGDEAATGQDYLDSHIRDCPRCTRVVALLREAQQSLSQNLRSQIVDLRSAQALAELAYRRVRRERLLRWIVLPVLLVVLLSIGAVITRMFGPELKRLVEPPPPVETSTFTLRCLSPVQAASLLRPYLPMPRNPMWQAERFDVRPADGGLQAVTVRAPHATMMQVPELLSRFEQDPTAACHTGGTKP